MEKWTTEQVANFAKDKDHEIEKLKAENEQLKAQAEAKAQEQAQDNKPSETVQDIIRNSRIIK